MHTQNACQNHHLICVSNAKIKCILKASIKVMVEQAECIQMCFNTVPSTDASLAPVT